MGMHSSPVSSTSSGSHFGLRVAIDDAFTYLAVSEKRYSSTNDGAVHIYKRNGSFELQTTLYGNSGEEFGKDIAMSRDASRLLVSTNTGIVRLYERDEESNSWSQVGSDFTKDSSSNYNSFGTTGSGSTSMTIGDNIERFAIVEQGSSSDNVVDRVNVYQRLVTGKIGMVV